MQWSSRHMPETSMRESCERMLKGSDLLALLGLIVVLMTGLSRQAHVLLL